MNRLLSRFSLAWFLAFIPMIFPQDLPKRTYTALRLVTDPPQIDGRLDDPCWDGEGWMGDFVQQTPNEGAAPSEETAFKILYDDQNLYVGFRAYVSDPRRFERRLSRRDQMAGDVIGLCLDSQSDRRTGYEFNLTSAGVKIDLLQRDTEGGWEVDESWDAVWEGRTAAWDSGWTAEMRIPFSQLRFVPRDTKPWGLHVWRWIHALGEEDQFQLIPLDSPGRVHRFGLLEGIREVPPPRRIECVPYVRLRLDRNPADGASTLPLPRNPMDPGAGIDGRIGIGGHFTLDWTVNPDFGQVEADPAIINLTAFETYFEEKRPFFVAGRSFMAFSFEDQPLFYSRRIGRPPTLSLRLDPQEKAEIPDQTTILEAIKLTGKTAGGWSVGMLQALGARETATITGLMGSRRETVEPMTHALVARVQRDFAGGRHALGMITTAVHRDLSNGSLAALLPRHAAVWGIDASFQTPSRTYYLNGKMLFSRVTGNPAALIRIQRSAVHFFQRPDARHLRVDSSATVLMGHGGSLEVGKGGNGRVRFSAGMGWSSPGLDFNDLGYLRETDRITARFSFGYVVNEPGRWTNRYAVSLTHSHAWDFGRVGLGTMDELYGNVEFRNFWGLHGFIQSQRERLDTRILRGGPALSLPDQWAAHLHLLSDYRKRVLFRLGGFWNRDRSGGWGRSFWPDVEMRIGSHLACALAPHYSETRGVWQYVGTGRETREGQTRFVIGRLIQQTFDLTLRLNLYLTPDLTIQYYGQPFLSSAQYGDFREVIDAHTMRPLRLFEGELEKGTLSVDDEADGTVDWRVTRPDFHLRSFRGNLVLRWEYRPGSTGYFVWTHGRSGSFPDGAFDLVDDFRNIWDLPPTNVFMVKVSHWFAL